jgi:hypothetical protein
LENPADLIVEEAERLAYEKKYEAALGEYKKLAKYKTVPVNDSIRGFFDRNDLRTYSELMDIRKPELECLANVRPAEQFGAASILANRIVQAIQTGKFGELASLASCQYIGDYGTDGASIMEPKKVADYFKLKGKTGDFKLAREIPGKTEYVLVFKPDSTKTLNLEVVEIHKGERGWNWDATVSMSEALAKDRKYLPPDSNGTGAIVSHPGTQRTKNPESEKLNNRVAQLNHCKDKSDCIDTEMSDLWCPPPALCGGCGILIHKDALKEFGKLAARAKGTATPPCRFNDFCGGTGCAIQCIAGKCVGKYSSTPPVY